MQRRDDYSIPLNLEMIRIFQTLYECKILASKAIILLYFSFNSCLVANASPDGVYLSH